MLLLTTIYSQILLSVKENNEYYIMQHTFLIINVQDILHKIFFSAFLEISDGINQLELAVNASNPKGNIIILTEINIYNNLPALYNNFQNSLSLINLRSNCICDVMGLVVYVGRPYRWSRKSNPSGGKLIKQA